MYFVLSAYCSFYRHWRHLQKAHESCSHWQTELLSVVCFTMSIMLLLMTKLHIYFPFSSSGTTESSFNKLNVVFAHAQLKYWVATHFSSVLFAFIHDFPFSGYRLYTTKDSVSTRPKIIVVNYIVILLRIIHHCK